MRNWIYANMPLVIVVLYFIRDEKAKDNFNKKFWNETEMIENPKH